MDIVDLGGNWHAESADKKHRVSAAVPGCIHTDLMAAGKIDDPFYRDNELGVQWIGETDWIYRRTFEVPASLLQNNRVLLRCDGLDTLATIRLNGHVIGRTDNMFRTWEFDVKSRLRAGNNRIEIRFDSAVNRVGKCQAKRRIPGGGGPLEIKGRAWIRKEPCNFGWDWGPTLVTCGIWRPIQLIAYDQARLADVRITQDHTRRGQVGIEVVLSAETASAQRLKASVSIAFAGKVLAVADTALQRGKARLPLPIKNPKLWWPNGMGNQPLYEVAVQLRDARDGLLDTVRKKIGLRTLRLDRHADKWGQSFQFVINGVPFFAKGANWIPADTFATRLTRERYAALIRDAAAANMNMLRVWGGGIYESDLFYELCDELGICVWQEFMFACSTYPTFDASFMRTVAAEAEDNVRRIRHHACLALWCGNNELEQGMVGPRWGEWQMSWTDYAKLFDRLLPSIVKRLDPQRDYWPSSPHSPLGDRKDYNNPHFGDAHLWDVWHGKKPFEWYRTCKHRFNSEFGFQSFPEPRTVHGYTEPADRNVTSRVMEHHQRSGIGNTTIMTYLLEWFRLPSRFDMILWLSQVLHGMAMKYAVEHWRRSRPRGMGTLYWQFDDCWPVASWASVDYHGRWKALHYLARHFFAPLLVSGIEDSATGKVAVHVTSDRLKTCRAKLSWKLTTVAGRSLASGQEAVAIPPNKNQRVTTLELGAFLKKYGAPNLLLWLELGAGGAIISSNLVTFARPKHLELPEPEIGFSLRPLTEREAAGFQATRLAPGQPSDRRGFAVTLKAKKPALWAWLEIRGRDARYSDNFIHLAPGRPATIAVWPAGNLSLRALRGKIKVRSLVDTYR